MDEDDSERVVSSITSTSDDRLRMEVLRVRDNKLSGFVQEVA